MEEKNRASEMLNQMKKYVHSEKDTSETEKNEAKVVPGDRAAEPKSPSKERARAIPTDDSLFEFDDITFDDVIIPEKPSLTPEEAEYAEQLSERFGVSRDAGVGFIDDTVADDARPRSFAPTADEINDINDAAVDEVIASAESDVQEIADQAEKVYAEVESEIDKTVNEAVAAVEDKADIAETAVGEIADYAEAAYKEVSVRVSRATDEIEKEMDITASSAVEALDEIAQPVYSAATQVNEAVKEIASEAKDVCNEIAQAVNASAPVIEKTVGEIADEAADVYCEISSEINNAVDEITSEVGVIAPDADETFDKIGDTVENKVREIVGGLEEAIGEIADEIEALLPEISVPVSKREGEPDQVVFGIDDQTEPEVKKAETPTGVQLTFLDTCEQTDAQEITGEQVVFGEEPEDNTVGQADSYAPNIEDDVQTEQPAIEEMLSEEAIIDTVIAQEIKLTAKTGEAQEAEDLDTEGESKPYQSPAAEELTPIEQSAIEEAERQRLEAQASSDEDEGERVKLKSFENDIWDESDRELYVAKKRYMEYCDQLSVPPLKHTKESKVKTSASGQKPASSGYRYEMTERLPLFADGRNGGRKTESYVNREMEYCEEREKKRTSQLLDKLRFSGRRLIFSFVIMLTVILVENINVIFTGKPDGLLNGDNAMIFSVALCALLIIGAALIYDSIRDGIKCAFSGVFIPETLTAGIVILTVIYHALLAFFGASSEYSMLFGTGASVVMFLTGLYRYNMQKRDYITFSVTASYGSYLTEVKMLGFRNSPEGKAYEGYADPEASLYRMNRVSRIDAPYNENPTRDECFGIIRKLTLCIVCAAVVSGVVFGIIKNDLIYGVISAISLITFAAPASVFVALSVPRLRAAAVSAEYGGAIADFDDESDEFDTSVIMIDDGELFPPENLVSSGFEMQRSPGIEIHLARTLALFKKIGGTMSALFSNVEGTIENFDSVVITEITENGISAVIDGVNISAGSESYMDKLGIRIKKSDKLIPKNGRVMYIADNGEFFARATLTFTPDMELVRKISELRNTETVFSLKSCNPCIDKELVFCTTGLEPELLRLVKYEAGDSVAPADTDREGSLVSKNGALGLLTALLEYKREKKLVFEASRLACFACAIGIFLSLLTSAFGVNFGFSSLLMLGFHGIMSLVGFVGAHRGAIKTKSKIKKK